MMLYQKKMELIFGNVGIQNLNVDTFAMKLEVVLMLILLQTILLIIFHLFILLLMVREQIVYAMSFLIYALTTVVFLFRRKMFSMQNYWVML
jgi:hypothetical protein